MWDRTSLMQRDEAAHTLAYIIADRAEDANALIERTFGG